MTYFNKEKLNDLFILAIKKCDKSFGCLQSCYLSKEGLLKNTRSLVKRRII